MLSYNNNNNKNINGKGFLKERINIILEKFRILLDYKCIYNFRNILNSKWQFL